MHAMTMGFLGSLLLAMVTRVSSGHSGRPLVADNRVWAVFCLLQVAVLVRIAASLPHMPGWGLALAASLWALLMALWGGRLLVWYGQPRADGRPESTAPAPIVRKNDGHYCQRGMLRRSGRP